MAQLEPQAAFGVRGAGGDGEFGHRADGSEGLAAKAEGADIVEVVGRQLGGGVALDGEDKVLRIHAMAIVFDADQAFAASSGGDDDPAGAGVDAVFHQFLDHARRPFHHFAGSDAVHEVWRQLADGQGRFSLAGV